MEKKLYLDATEFLRDTWRLGRAILDSNWRPDVLIALWRGGATPGVAIHEFLKFHGMSVRHMPVKCSSYTGIEQSNTEVAFDHADGALATLAPGEKVLVVDDVFDTGRTAAAVHSIMQRLGCEMKMACVYWKPSKNVTQYRPDFYVKAIEEWIVFPHEMEGLTHDEIIEKDSQLARLVKC